MAKWKPTRRQFFTLGLPSEACTAPARPVSVDATSDTFELPGHGFELADLIRFRADGQSLDTTAALPAPLVASVLVEAVPIGGDMFQVRPSGGGAIIALTNAGAGVVQVVADYMAKLDLILEAEARYVDDHATPYDVDSETFVPPLSFVKAACERAALKVATTLRSASPSYSIDDVRKAADAAQVFLDLLRSGKPLAVRPVDATPAIAEMGAQAFSRRPPRGFRRDSL